jgi:hypothetical protein
LIFSPAIASAFLPHHHQHVASLFAPFIFTIGLYLQGSMNIFDDIFLNLTIVMRNKRCGKEKKGKYTNFKCITLILQSSLQQQ